LIVSAGEFNPARYEALCDILSKSYLRNGNPVDVLQLFLSVTVTGRCSIGEKGELYRISDYETNAPFQNYNLKGKLPSPSLNVVSRQLSLNDLPV